MTTCGRARRTGPTASRPSRWPPRGPSGSASARASSTRSRAASRCSPSTPPRSRTPAAGASCSGSARRRTSSSSAGTAIPFARPLSRVREAVEALRPILAGERGPTGFKLEKPPETPPPIVLAALRGRMLGLAAEVADGAFTNFLPLSGAPRIAEAFGAPDKELVCRFFCIPRARGGGPRHRALDVRGLRDGPRLHRVLPLAGLGRADRPDGRGVAGGRPPARARARPGRPRAGDLRLRRARAAARAPAAVRRRGHHDVRAHADLPARPAARRPIEALAPE